MSKEREINKTYKINEVIFVAEGFKKSAHSGATGLFFGFFRREKDELRGVGYYSAVPKQFFFSLCLVWSIFSALVFIQCSPKTTPPKTEVEVTNAKPITAAWTKIVRGANNCPLTAQSIGDGNNPKVGPNEPLTDLSVNASDDKKVSYTQLAANLPNPHYGFTTLGDLRKANKHILIVRDPLPGNPYHCLISVITPKQYASRTNCE